MKLILSSAYSASAGNERGNGHGMITKFCSASQDRIDDPWMAQVMLWSQIRRLRHVSLQCMLFHVTKVTMWQIMAIWVVNIGTVYKLLELCLRFVRDSHLCCHHCVVKQFMNMYEVEMGSPRDWLVEWWQVTDKCPILTWIFIRPRPALQYDINTVMQH